MGGIPLGFGIIVEDIHIRTYTHFKNSLCQLGPLRNLCIYSTSYTPHSGRSSKSLDQTHIHTLQPVGLSCMLNCVNYTSKGTLSRSIIQHAWRRRCHNCTCNPIPSLCSEICQLTSEATITQIMLTLHAIRCFL